MPSTEPDLNSAVWHRSTYSDGGGGDCVEVGDGVPGAVPVRDSKCPDFAALRFPVAAWSAFIDDVKRGAKRHGR